MKKSLFFLAFLCQLNIGILQSKTKTLSLKEALKLTEKYHPALAVYAKIIQSADGEIKQAGLWVNPELEMGFEDFAGQDDLSGSKSMESTFKINKTILRGQKRQRALRVAKKNKDLLSWDYKSKRLDLLLETTLAFIDLLASQEGLKLAQKKLTIAKSMLNAVTIRVRSGKVSPLEKMKAKVLYARANLEMKKIEREKQIKRKALAMYWSQDSNSSFELLGSLNIAEKSLSKKESNPEANPDWSRWDTEFDFQKAQIALEKSRGVPDINMGLGLKKLNGTKGNSALFSFSIPLPLYNKNQGNIQKAKNDLLVKKEQKKAVRLRIRKDYFEIQQKIQSLFREAKTLQKTILPQAKGVYKATKEGYKQGKLAYLDMLDAQTTLLETEKQLLNSQQKYQKLKAQIQRLSGQPFVDLLN